MARIRIKDLPNDKKLSKKEMKNVAGGAFDGYLGRKAAFDGYLKTLEKLSPDLKPLDGASPNLKPLDGSSPNR